MEPFSFTDDHRKLSLVFEHDNVELCHLFSFLMSLFFVYVCSPWVTFIPHRTNVGVYLQDHTVHSTLKINGMWTVGTASSAIVRKEEYISPQSLSNLWFTNQKRRQTLQGGTNPSSSFTAVRTVHPHASSSQ